MNKKLMLQNLQNKVRIIDTQLFKLREIKYGFFTPYKLDNVGHKLIAVSQDMDI